MIRVTMHNGRFGSIKHNARGFDLEKSDHIDPNRVELNEYLFWDSVDFDEDYEVLGSEERYYYYRFGDALQKQNERYKAKGNYSRIHGMDTWLTDRKTCPEETILQIGDKSAKIDPDDFSQAIREYIEWQEEWSRDHGDPFQILNVSIQHDEASHHCHSRKVWQYQDKDGTWKIGQNKALEAAGVPLPDPSAPISKENNRKITFDRLMRERWIQICEEHGYDVNRIPDPTHNTNIPKAGFIELQEKKAELERVKSKFEAKRVLVASKEKRLDERAADLDKRYADLLEAERAAKVEAARIVSEARKEAQETVRAARDMRVQAERVMGLAEAPTASRGVSRRRLPDLPGDGF